MDAATLGPMVGICLLVQPELVVGAVVVIGVVVVAAAIAAELSKTCDCYCMDTGFVGDRVKAAYPIGQRKNEYACIDDCVTRGYPNGGFCR